MADNNINEDVERVELPGSGDKDAPESKGEDGTNEDPDEDESLKDDSTEENAEPAPPAATEDKGGEDGNLNDVDGETPRERALRLKLADSEKENRRLLGQDLKIGEAPIAVKKELPPERADILKKYRPEEIAALREVLPVLAEDMGYVRTDQLNAQQYAERSEIELQEFLKEHPVYLPEKDKDGLLWGKFKENFQMYKQPKDPKDFKKIFNRIHTDIFGIKPAGDKGAITAAQQKIKVASHAGASSPNRSGVSDRPRAGSPGLRLDMLKGFSDEERSEMLGE